MQKKLLALGYMGSEADGNYGSKTKAAVKSFEKANKLSADGVADDKMLDALSATYDKAPRITVTGVPANIRSGAGTSFAKLGTVQKGSEYVVRATASVSGTKWYNFTYGTKSVWIKGTLVKYSAGGAKPAAGGTAEQKSTKTAKVTANTLNARSGAGTTYKKVATLKKGFTFTVTGSKNVSGTTWYSFVYNGSTAWASGKYLSVSSSATSPSTAKTTKKTTAKTAEKTTKATVPSVSGKGLSDKYGEIVNISSALKVRNGAGEKYTALGTLPMGAQVVITGSDKSGKWLSVRYGSRTGWVNAAYVKTVKNSSSAVYGGRAQVKKKAQSILSSMSLQEKIGQLLCIESGGTGEKSMKELIKGCKPGAVVLKSTDLASLSPSQVKTRIKGYQSSGGGKMLVCVSEEGGSVVSLSSNRKLRSASYASPRSLYSTGGYKAIADDTADKCRFLKGFGVNVNIGPVADIATGKSAYMYSRSFGMSASATAKFVSTAVGTMKAYRVGSVLKHFPGLGNGANNAKNTKSLSGLKGDEFVPFKSGVGSGADAIMVAPVILSGVDKKAPATISSKCTALIRDYLKFDGVVIADGTVTSEVKKQCGGKDPAVASLCGGCDMIYCPKDPRQAVKAITAAVKNGTLSEKRIDESVLRILMWKIDLELYK